jgi:hypothetical protein
MVLTQHQVLRAGIILSCFFVLALAGPTKLYSSSGEPDTTEQYVLHVSDAVQAAELVTALGGSVQSQSAVLSAVTAELSQEQFELVTRSSLVFRVSNQSDGEVVREEQQVASNWWLL